MKSIIAGARRDKDQLGSLIGMVFMALKLVKTFKIKTRNAMMRDIPGAVDFEELKKLARENGGMIKYYIATQSRTTHRFLDDAGKFAWDEHGPWHPANPDYPRFTNYWYAYAYNLRLTKKEETTI